MITKPNIGKAWLYVQLLFADIETPDDIEWVKNGDTYLDDQVAKVRHRDLQLRRAITKRVLKECGNKRNPTPENIAYMERQTKRLLKEIAQQAQQ